jgi:hypothetical protein
MASEKAGGEIAGSAGYLERQVVGLRDRNLFHEFTF